MYERLAIPDIQAAADAFRPAYEKTGFRDGYVSLEVSPFLAADTGATIDQARRLWKTVGRENVMIKVPGTPEGLPAIEQLLSEGININITLLFSQDVYEKVALAYLSGLEKRVRRSEENGQRSQFLRQPHRHSGRLDGQSQTEDGHLGIRARAARKLVGQSRDRQRQAGLPALQESVPGASMGRAGGAGRTRAAAAVGQHQHQRSHLSRRDVHRGVDRARHREHDSPVDVRRVPRSRQAARRAWKTTWSALTTPWKRWRRRAFPWRTSRRSCSSKR